MNRIIYSLAVSSLLAGGIANAQLTVRDTVGITTAANWNAAEMLRGRISGVRVSSMDGNPVGGANINIRGVNSLRSDNQPLWIVDGMAISYDLNENLDAFWQFGESSYTSPLNPLAFLNANDIESIEVLKDISATTIYGARGANGVIIINTKRGLGDSEKDVRIRSNAGFNQKGGFSHNHSVSMSGSVNNTNYNVSAAYRNINGELPNNSSNFASIKGNFETMANKVLWFGFNTLMSLGNSSSPSGVSYLGRPSLTLAARDAALSPATSYDNWVSDYDDMTNDFRVIASTYLRLNLTRKFFLKFSGGIDHQKDMRNIWYGKTTELGSVSDWNENGGAASNLISQLLSFDVQAEMNYNTFISTDHKLSLKVVGESYGKSNDFNTMNGYNFVLDKIRGKSLNVGNYAVGIHTFNRTYSHVGGYASLGYDYKGAAGIGATYRIDSNPKYGKDEVHHYPSVEAYFDVHNLFFSGVKTLSALKLSGGYGKSGCEKYVPYELFGNFLSGEYFEVPYGTSSFYDGINITDAAEWHADINASFFSDRLKLAVSFYDRTTTDDFLMYQMGHPIEGSDIYVKSYDGKVFDRRSSVNNQGVDIDLSTEVIKSGKWSWIIAANAEYNRNYVTDCSYEDIDGRKVGSGMYCTCNALYKSASSLYGYLEDANGKIKDITGEGTISDVDKVILGNTVPVVSGGLQSVLRYGNFTFSILADGAAGHKIANLNNVVRDGRKLESGLYALTESYIEDADYLRLSELGVSYRIPVKAKFIKDLRVNLIARNLATFSKYSGWNPEVNCFGVSALSNGLDYGSYPINKLFMAGICIKF